MNKWSAPSTERAQCVVCGKMGGSWARFETRRISITIPVCDKHHGGLTLKNTAVIRSILTILCRLFYT